MLKRILQQARRAHRQRGVHLLDQGPQVAADEGRQLRADKGVSDPVVRCVGQGKGIQVVELHELLEDIGAEHRKTRNSHRDAGKILGMTML